MRAPATATAQAAVPQARVRPVPRSQTFQSNPVAGEHLGQRNIGTLGKAGDARAWAEATEIIDGEILHPEYAMRVADVDHGRRVEDRLVDWPYLQLDMAGVAEFLRQRNIAQPKRGMPMSTVTSPSPALVQ